MEFNFIYVFRVQVPPKGASGSGSKQRKNGDCAAAVRLQAVGSGPQTRYRSSPRPEVDPEPDRRLNALRGHLTQTGQSEFDFLSVTDGRTPVQPDRRAQARPTPSGTSREAPLPVRDQ